MRQTHPVVYSLVGVWLSTSLNLFYTKEDVAKENINLSKGIDWEEIS